MKQLFLTMALLTLFVCPAMTQNTLNNKADNIIGQYLGEHNGEQFKVRISKMSDGTYQGQVMWLEISCDKNGNKLLDVKNPDKSLRNTPCDQIVLFSGLKYNAKKQCWDGAKIYDPQRGLRANMTAEFTKEGKLKIRGSLMGIGESVYWQPSA